MREAQSQRIDRRTGKSKVNCFYIEYCERDRDNYPCSHPRLDYGIFAIKGDADNVCAMLNNPIKLQWESDKLREDETLLRRQKEWDALNAAGLATHTRPERNSNQSEEWQPDPDDGCFRVESVEFHLAK